MMIKGYRKTRTIWPEIVILALLVIALGINNDGSFPIEGLAFFSILYLLHCLLFVRLKTSWITDNLFGLNFIFWIPWKFIKKIQITKKGVRVQTKYFPLPLHTELNFYENEKFINDLITQAKKHEVSCEKIQSSTMQRP